MPTGGPDGELVVFLRVQDAALVHELELVRRVVCMQRSINVSSQRGQSSKKLTDVFAELLADGADEIVRRQGHVDRRAALNACAGERRIRDHQQVAQVVEGLVKAGGGLTVPLRSLMTTSMWILPLGNQLEPARTRSGNQLSRLARTKDEGLKGVPGAVSSSSCLSQ